MLPRMQGAALQRAIGMTTRPAMRWSPAWAWGERRREVLVDPGSLPEPLELGLEDQIIDLDSALVHPICFELLLIRPEPLEQA